MAKRNNTTMPKLARRTVVECESRNEREAAMRAAIGIRESKSDDMSPAKEIRALRRGSRIKRIFFE